MLIPIVDLSVRMADDAGEIDYEDEHSNPDKMEAMEVYLAEEEDVERAARGDPKRPSPWELPFTFFRYEDPSHTRFGEVINDETQEYAEYTGNESQPECWDSVYYTAALLVVPKKSQI